MMRTTDRRTTSGPFDRERFLVSNDLASRLDRVSGEKHDYVLRHLVTMRLAGHDMDGAIRLLTDFDFLAAKTAALLLPDLIRDYDAAIDQASADTARDLQRLRRALELSRFLLEHDPEQLPEQLLGRLAPASSERIGCLLEHVGSYKKEPWLRPLAGHLTAPDAPLVQTLVGPPGHVDRIALFPDSRTCLSASGTSLIVWDLEGGLDKLTLIGDDSDVTDLLVSSDSRFAVLAVRSETIQIWDLETRKLRCTLTGHESAVLTLAMAPGGRLISGSTDNTIRVWDLERGELLRVLNVGATVHTLAVLPEGRHLLSGGGSEPGPSDQNALTLWDLESGTRLGSFAGHYWPIDALAVSSSGQDVIFAASDALEIWDLPSRTLRHSLRGHKLRTHALVTVPSHRLAVSSGGDGLVMLWDLVSGQRLKTLRGHHATVIDVEVTRDARFAISASWDQTIKVWDLDRARQPELAPGHTGRVHALAVTPYQRYAVSASDDHRLLIWSLSSFAPVRELLGHGHWVRALALTPDGCHVLSASWDGTLRLWNLETAEQLISIHLRMEDEHFEAVALAPDGHRAIAGTYNGVVALWDLEIPEEPLAVFKASEKGISSLALLLDGLRAIVASNDGSLKIWDLERGVLLETLDSGPPPLPSSGDEAADLMDVRRVGRPHWTNIRLLPGGHRALTSSSGGVLALWNLETGIQEGSWQACAVGITDLALTSEGRLAAATSGMPYYASDNTLRIWDLETQDLVARFVGESPFLSCAICPDGVTLVAGDEAGLSGVN